MWVNLQLSINNLFKFLDILLFPYNFNKIKEFFQDEIFICLSINLRFKIK